MYITPPPVCDLIYQKAANQNFLSFWRPVAASKYLCQLMCVDWFQLLETGQAGHDISPPSATQISVTQAIHGCMGGQ